MEWNPNEFKDAIESANVSGGWTIGREALLKKACIHFKIPVAAFDIVECQDEKSGVRFGQSLCRRGWAHKLGGGGRNKGSRYAYQVWAVVKPEHR